MEMETWQKENCRAENAEHCTALQKAKQSIKKPTNRQKTQISTLTLKATIFYILMIRFWSWESVVPEWLVSGKLRICSNHLWHSRHLRCLSSRETSTPMPLAHGSRLSCIIGRKLDKITRKLSQARV